MAVTRSPAGPPCQRQPHRTPQSAGALDPDPVDVQAGPLEQRQQLGDARFGDRERQGDDQDAENVDDGHGDGAFVRVDSGDSMGDVHVRAPDGVGAYSG